MHTIFKLDYYNFISTLNKQPQTLNLQKKMEKGHLSFIRVGSIFFLFFILLLKCGTFNKTEEQINSEKTALEKEKEEIIAEEKKYVLDNLAEIMSISAKDLYEYYTKTELYQLKITLNSITYQDLLEKFNGDKDRADLYHEIIREQRYLNKALQRYNKINEW